MLFDGLGGISAPGDLFDVSYLQVLTVVVVVAAVVSQAGYITYNLSYLARPLPTMQKKLAYCVENWSRAK